MGSASSVNEAKSEEDPSTNPSSAISREEEESKILIEDLNETKEREEEEEEECALCKYIKGGKCKDAFIELERCVDESAKNGEESDVSKCNELRLMFKTCLYENPLYYEPILGFEAKMIAKALQELQAEKKASLDGEAVADTSEAILVDEAADIARALSKLDAEKKKEAQGSNGNNE